MEAIERGEGYITIELTIDSKYMIQAMGSIGM